MKDFFADLFDACKGGSGNRMFWIFVTVAIIIIGVLIPVLAVLNIVMLVKGWWQIMYLLLLLFSIAAEVVAVLWVNKKRD